MHDLRVAVYCTSYELLFDTSYQLLFIARVTSYFITMSYNENEDDKAVYDNKVMINDA